MCQRLGKMVPSRTQSFSTLGTPRGSPSVQWRPAVLLPLSGIGRIRTGPRDAPGQHGALRVAVVVDVMGPGRGLAIGARHSSPITLKPKATARPAPTMRPPASKDALDGRSATITKVACGRPALGGAPPTARFDYAVTGEAGLVVDVITVVRPAAPRIRPLTRTPSCPTNQDRRSIFSLEVLHRAKPRKWRAQDFGQRTLLGVVRLMS